MYSDRHLRHLQGEPTQQLFGLTTRIEYLSPYEKKKRVRNVYVYTQIKGFHDDETAPFALSLARTTVEVRLGKNTQTHGVRINTLNHTCVNTMESEAAWWIGQHLILSTHTYRERLSAVFVLLFAVDASDNMHTWPLQKWQDRDESGATSRCRSGVRSATRLCFPAEEKLATLSRRG